MLSLDYLRNNIYNLSYFNPRLGFLQFSPNVYRITYSPTLDFLDFKQNPSNLFFDDLAQLSLIETVDGY
jgi:hypothetical protein